MDNEKLNQFGASNPFRDKEAVLNMVKEVFEFEVNPRDFHQMSFDVRQAFGKYVVYVMRKAFGEKIQQEVPVVFSYKVPNGWWQHFKQENFPAWLLRRYPVKYEFFTETKTVQFDRTFVFPEAYQEGHDILGKFIIRDYHRIKGIKGEWGNL